jgi:hypothetical protein
VAPDSQAGAAMDRFQYWNPLGIFEATYEFSGSSTIDFEVIVQCYIVGQETTREL